MIDTVTCESNLCPTHKVTGFCDQAQNVGKVRRHGVELGLEQRFSPTLAAGVNYKRALLLIHEKQARPLHTNSWFCYIWSKGCMVTSS